MVSLVGCKVLLGNGDTQSDLFQLIDEQRGNVYKFRTGSQIAAERWCKHIQQAAKGEQNPLPTNLMSFE